MKKQVMDKSNERLAMEIKGKNRAEAEKHLIKYGASEAGAAAAVAYCFGIFTKMVTNDEKYIADGIEMNCP